MRTEVHLLTIQVSHLTWIALGLMALKLRRCRKQLRHYRATARTTRNAESRMLLDRRARQMEAHILELIEVRNNVQKIRRKANKPFQRRSA